MTTSTGGTCDFPEKILIFIEKKLIELSNEINKFGDLEKKLDRAGPGLKILRKCQTGPDRAGKF